MPILSVIVPVYNVATFLKEGLDSVIDQNIKDIEVICINDDSSDNSLDILKQYRNKDSRFIIINNKKNIGVSASRNIGIQNAKGKYLVFFDPDDIIGQNMYFKLISTIEKTKVDIVMCGYKTFPDGKITIPDFIRNKPSNPYEFIDINKKHFTQNDFCYTWHLMFKSSLIINNNIRFNERINVGEDTLFNLEAIIKSKSIVLVPLALYNYRINNTNSIMKKKYNPYLEQSLQLQFKEKKILINKFNIIKSSIFTKDMFEDTIKRYTIMLIKNLKNNPNEKNKYKGVRRIVNMPMIKEAAKIVGFRNIYSSWKEYIFYMAVKFRVSFIVYKLYFR